VVEHEYIPGYQLDADLWDADHRFTVFDKLKKVRPKKRTTLQCIAG